MMIDGIEFDFEGSPLMMVNTTGKIACPHCLRIIYELREGKEFGAVDILRAEDFSGYGEIADPVNGVSLDCPRCQKPMILVERNIGA